MVRSDQGEYAGVQLTNRLALIGGRIQIFLSSQCTATLSQPASQGEQQMRDIPTYVAYRERRTDAQSQEESCANDGEHTENNKQ